MAGHALTVGWADDEPLEELLTELLEQLLRELLEELLDELLEEPLEELLEDVVEVVVTVGENEGLADDEPDEDVSVVELLDETTDDVKLLRFDIGEVEEVAVVWEEEDTEDDVDVNV